MGFVPAHKRWMCFILRCQDCWVAEFGNWLFFSSLKQLGVVAKCRCRCKRSIPTISTSQRSVKCQTQLWEPGQKLVFSWCILVVVVVYFYIWFCLLLVFCVYVLFYVCLCWFFFFLVGKILWNIDTELLS